MAPERVDLLVVGGGPAAHAAVLAHRRHGGTGRVLLVSADDRTPYDRPPLSKAFLRADLAADQLPIDPTGLRDSGVELLLGARVVALDPVAGTATLAGGEVVSATRCLLATGAVAVRPDVPGGDDPRLLVLRTAADAERLREAAARARTAVVVGSGFIGCEAAVSLAATGLDVTQVSDDAVPQQQRLGEQVGRRVAGWLRESGVEPVGAAEVERIARSGEGHLLRLGDGRELRADLVLLATGARPAGELAAAAGLQVSAGRVVVDEQMRSSSPWLLAAGDAVLAHHPVAGRLLPARHWGEALATGAVAGAVAAGADSRWQTLPGFWSGIGPRTLKQVAWGDGWDHVDVVEHRGGGFTAWYGRDGVVVGVLTHDADDDLERGARFVHQGAPLPGGGGR